MASEYLFLLLLSFIACSSGTFTKDHQVFQLSRRELFNNFHLKVVENDELVDPASLNFPTTPLVTNPVTTPSIVPPDNSATPTIVTIPATNPIATTPIPVATPAATIPPATPIPVPNTNPVTPAVPVTNPVTTPNTNPVATPAATIPPATPIPVPNTNPVTPAVPVTNPVTTPNTNPVATPAATIPPATPIPVPNTNPVTPAVPVTNPVTTPSTNPVTNPVTTPTPSGGGVPVTTPPVTNPNPTPTPTPANTNAPAVPGQTWCVAKSGLQETALQSALDYACGIGGADCSAIQQSGVCYNPNSLQNHASFAFNSYYQKNPSPTSCDFGGTAMVTSTNPSSGSCIYPLSSSSSSSSSPPATTASTGPAVPGSSTGTGAGAGAGFGTGTPPNLLNASNPMPGGAMPGFADSPPTTISSMSNKFQYFSCISTVATILTGIITLF